jgi:hypothetical protein
MRDLAVSQLSVTGNCALVVLFRICLEATGADVLSGQAGGPRGGGARARRAATAATATKARVRRWCFVDALCALSRAAVL